MSRELKLKFMNPFYLWTACCSHLLLWISFLFGKTGKWIARHPCLVIILAHIMVLFFATGFIFMKFEKNTQKLYDPQSSQAERDLDKASKYFSLNFRREMLILEAQDKVNGVLEEHCLTEALVLHNAITGIPGYREFCMKDLLRNECIAITPLELLHYNQTNFMNISERLTAVYRNKSYLMMNGRPAYYNFPAMFGKTLELSLDGRVERAQVLQMIYLTRNPSNEEEHRRILQFEKSFLHVVSQAKLKQVKVFYKSARSVDDAVNESSISDISLFLITFFIMMIFACLASGNLRKPSHGHALLATSCVIAVSYGIISGLGLGMWLGLPFVSIVGFLPFLVVGVGLDDMFIIVNEFDRLPRGLPVVTCVSVVMRNTGSSITMTTVTTLAAYIISTSTSFLAIRYFCLYATFCIVFSYLFVIGLFVALLTLDGYRIKVGRLDCLPCLIVKECSIRENITFISDTEKREKPVMLLADKIMRNWAKFLLTTPSRVTVVLILIGMVSFGVISGRRIDQRFDNELIAKPGSYLEKYLQTLQAYYSESLEINVMVEGNVNYELWTIQNELLKLSSIARENPFYQNHSLSWIKAFRMWCKASQRKATGENFMKSLKTFLSLPPFRHFRQDVVFSKDETKIIASRVLLYTKSTTDTMIMTDAMVGIRRDLDIKSTLPVFAITKEFLSLETYLSTPSETMRNILLSSFTIVLVSSVYLVHPAVILLVFVNFLFLVIELLGILHLLNVPLNTIAMVGFVMAVGYSVDYSAHIAHAYILSQEETAKERVVHALTTVGSSVFWGGLSTLLGLIIIAFSESKLFQLLFRMLMSIVSLGLLHGLVFLPVLLSLFCPWKFQIFPTKDKNNNDDENDEMIALHRQSKDTFYATSIDSNCPCDFCDRFKQDLLSP